MPAVAKVEILIQLTFKRNVVMCALRTRTQVVSRLTVAASAVLATCCAAQASTQYGTGSFNWDHGLSPHWSLNSGGLYDLVWDNGNDAVFEGTPGTVSIAAAGVSAQNLTFNSAGFIVQNNTLTLSGAPVFTANANATINSAIAGGADLTKAGEAVLTLSGANTYSGATTVSDGMLQIGDGTANPALNTAAYTIADGSTLRLFTSGNWVANGQQSFFENLAGSGTLRLSSSGGIDWPGSGAQYYVKFSPNFTGSLVIDRGRVPVKDNEWGGVKTVTINHGGQVANWWGGTISPDFIIGGYFDEEHYTGALRTANNGNTSILNGKIALTASTEITGSGITYLNGVISGVTGANLTCSGNISGQIIMSADNTYPGDTILTGGVTLQLGNGGTAGSLVPAAITLAEVQDGDAHPIHSKLKFKRSDTISQGVAFGTISGSGGIVQGGTGTVVLTTGNTYQGDTIVEAGTLKLDSPVSAYRYYRFRVLAHYGSGDEAYNQFSELHFYSNGVWTAAVDGYPASGVEVNTGENHYSQANDNNKETKFGQGGLPYELTYDFGTPRCFDSYNWATANDSTPARNPSQWTVFGSNDNAAWTALTGVSGQQGPTTTFTWAGVHAAGYTEVDGSPDGGAANAYPLQSIPLSTVVQLAVGAKLDLNGNDLTIAALTDRNGSGGSVINSASIPVALTLCQAAGETVFSGVIADNGSANAISLVKLGSGTLTLSGNHGYTGLTDIQSGTLKVASLPGYRFYKFQVNSVYGGGATGLQYSEMAFYSSGTNPNDGTRVFPAVATGDGGLYKDNGLPGLYDNNVHTKSYMDSPFPRFVVYDFGAPRMFTGYDWASANDATPDRNPDSWTMHGSNDGSNWSLLDTQSNAGATPTATHTYAAGWPLAPYTASLCKLTDAAVQIAAGATLDLGGGDQSIGSLSGAGVVSNGALAVTGMIMPGKADAINTLTLAVTEISGTLLADVAKDGSCDMLAAQGDLNLSGLSLAIANSDQLDYQREYTLITCAGTRSGRFASITGVAPGWHAQYMPDGSVQLVYSGGTVILIQ